jgi:molybdopterin adenylyltransferase
MGTREHKKHAPKTQNIAILTASTTRSLSEDQSGLWMKKRAQKEKCTVVDHQVVSDDAEVIASTLTTIIEQNDVDAVLVNGGTGVSPKDVTIEAVRPLFDKEISAFGVLFSQLSYEQIDSAALLSRATAGVIGHTVVFCMPGSLKAAQLACKALIFPELGHLTWHVRGE